MKFVGVRELKDKLSSYIRAAQAGERVIVTDHGKPVAELSAPSFGAEPFSEAQRDLIERGILKPGRKSNSEIDYPKLKPLLTDEAVKQLLDDVRGER